MHINVTKVGQGHLKLLLVQCFSWINQAAWILSAMSLRCSGTRNVASFRTVPKVRGDLTCIYVENNKSYETGYSGCKHPRLTIRRNAHIRRMPKGQDWNARVASVLPKGHKSRSFQGKWPLSEEIKSVLREFVTAPIYVLCSNITKIVRREGSEIMRFCWQKVHKMRSVCRRFAPVCRSAPKNFQGSVPTTKWSYVSA